MSKSKKKRHLGLGNHNAADRRRIQARLAERDGEQCWLCLGHLDMTLRDGSDWSVSIDHVIPRCKGGGHGMHNWKLAHKWCNETRIA
jgi:5-methylcytosine-specific restriction endonuclease McrA